jgi:hypothetical protein
MRDEISCALRLKALGINCHEKEAVGREFLSSLTPCNYCRVSARQPSYFCFGKSSQNQ